MQHAKAMIALFIAAGKGNYDCVISLIQADANISNASRITALMEAVFKNHDKCVNALIEAGTDVNIRDENRVIALMFAALKDNDKCMKTLIKAGADVNVADVDGFTALMHVTFNLHGHFLKTLYEAATGKSPKFSTDPKKTAFHRLPTDVKLSVKCDGITLIPSSSPLPDISQQ